MFNFFGSAPEPQTGAQSDPIAAAARQMMSADPTLTFEQALVIARSNVAAQAASGGFAPPNIGRGSYDPARMQELGQYANPMGEFGGQAIGVPQTSSGGPGETPLVGQQELAESKGLFGDLTTGDALNIASKALSMREEAQAKAEEEALANAPQAEIAEGNYRPGQYQPYQLLYGITPLTGIRGR